MIIGSHVSFKDDQLYGSIKEALSYNANALMIYTGAPQNTIRKDIDIELLEKATKLAKDNNIEFKNIICHAPYIVNLANKEKQEFSINFLIQELKRCEMLKIDKMVLHPGSSVGITPEEGIENISNALKVILEKNIPVDILLETMAGKGNEVGRNLDQISKILSNVNSKRLNVCLDTCHLNDSGIDINNFDEYLDDFDKKIGINKIKCIHLNDSKNEISSHKDRHENIGFGTIGFNALYKVLTNERLINIPKILETPYIEVNEKEKKPPYKEEIKMLKENKFNPDIFK